MAALLHLLTTGEGVRDEVVFRDEVLLEKLKWPDTSESRLAIRMAVERYFSTVYRRLSTEALGEGGGQRRSSLLQKLIPSYEARAEWLQGPPSEARKSTIVQSTPHLLDDVCGEEKYFLGLNFERLGQLERIKTESSGDDDVN